MSEPVRFPPTAAPASVPSVSVDRTVDCLGLFCPMPLVRTRDAIRAMTPGQVLEMLADDPGSDADVRTWARRTGQELLEASKSGSVYRFLVRKVR